MLKIHELSFEEYYCYGKCSKIVLEKSVGVLICIFLLRLEALKNCRQVWKARISIFRNSNFHEKM